MPGYTPNIFNFIRNKNGSEALKLARALERVTLSVMRFKDHLHFNHRLKDNNILPKTLQFNPPVKSKEGWKIARKAGQAYLRLRLSNCHTQIKKLSQRLSQTTHKLREIIYKESFDTLLLTIKERSQWEAQRRRKRHKKKLQNILPRPPTHETNLKDKWVVYISGRPLSASEHSALSLNFNFAITPQSLPVPQIVSSIESGIDQLPDAEKDLVRASVTSAINSWRPPQRKNITSEEEKALKDLAKDKSVTILPADKGRAVVVMNTNDYTEKVNNLLNDGKTYQKITDKRRNPTSSTEKSLNKLLLQIKDQPAPHDSDKKQLEPKLYHKLHSTDSTPASFYGLPKIHKDNVPLRPIMSAIGSPTYELSKYLANILSPLQNNKYTVKNSASFVEKIRTMSVDPDEILVSFDVVSLFTCIPTHLAMEVVKERLDFDQSLPERTKLSIQNIIALLQFVLDNNFLVFQGDHFKQNLRLSDGISSQRHIIANLVMEYVEEKALSSAPNSPKWWFRYVDDSHVCIKREHADEFHSHLNSINTNIKFTIEIESEGSIAFLDTRTTRQDDGSITVSVYSGGGGGGRGGRGGRGGGRGGRGGGQGGQNLPPPVTYSPASRTFISRLPPVSMLLPSPVNWQSQNTS